MTGIISTSNSSINSKNSNDNNTINSKKSLNSCNSCNTSCCPDSESNISISTTKSSLNRSLSNSDSEPSSSSSTSSSSSSETTSLSSNSTIEACIPTKLNNDQLLKSPKNSLLTIPTITTASGDNNNNSISTPLLDKNSIITENTSFNSSNPENNNNNLETLTSNLQKSSNSKVQKDNENNNLRRVFKCSICMSKRSEKHFPVLPCGHKTCKACLRTYLNLEINEGRTKIGCPVSKSCNWNFGRAAVARLVGSANPEIMQKWDKFQLQRCLYLIPNMVFCPFPDCDWAVVAPKDQKKCPKITCETCKKSFCYNCRNPWEGNHKGDKCLLKNDRNRLMQSISTGQGGKQQGSKNSVKTTNFDGTSNRLPECSNEVKPCPQCGALIAKVMDGGCNHIVCSVCNCHFCWLCLKEVTEVHFLSPSGCTFWGNDLWSTRKRVLFQVLGFLCSPLIVLCLILLSIPAILVALPILTYKYTTAWSKKLTAKNNSIQQKNRECFQGTIIWGATILSVLVSPIAAVCGAVIIAPISILYVFCIVPLDLIRNRTLFNQDSLNLVERGLNRINNRNNNNKSSSMKSLSENENNNDDVEAGLQIQEEKVVESDNYNSTKIINEISETDKLINSNPVQKSVLPPTYDYIINAANSLTNLAELGSSRSKSKRSSEDSNSLEIIESDKTNLCKKLTATSDDVE